MLVVFRFQIFWRTFISSVVKYDGNSTRCKENNGERNTCKQIPSENMAWIRKMQHEIMFTMFPPLGHDLDTGVVALRSSCLLRRPRLSRISSYLSPSLFQARRGIPYLRWSGLWGRALHHWNRHRPTTYTWWLELPKFLGIQFTRWVSSQHNTTNPAPNKVERCILIYPGSSFVWLASLRKLTQENGWHHVTISDLQKTTIKTIYMQNSTTSLWCT